MSGHRAFSELRAPMTAERRHTNQIATARLVADLSALVPSAPTQQASAELLDTSSEDVSSTEKRGDA